MRTACDSRPKMDRTADQIVMVQRYIGIEEQTQKDPRKAKDVSRRLHMAHIGLSSRVFACMKDGYVVVNSPNHSIELFGTRSQKPASLVVPTSDGALEAMSIELMVTITARPVTVFKASVRNSPNDFNSIHELSAACDSPLFLSYEHTPS